MLKKLQARIKSLLSKGDNISHSEITELERFKNDIDLEGQIKSFLDKMKDKFTSGKANTTEKNSNSETLDLVPNSCFQSYREDGVTPKSSRDKEGNVTYYREDGKTVDSVHSADGSWYHYREDGITLKSLKDKDGKRTYFQEDGKTVSCIFDNEGNFTSLEKIYYKNDEHGNNIGYREKDNSIASMLSTDGTYRSYREDGKTLRTFRDKDGNSTHYREDGKTVDFEFDKDGVFRSYREDGKTLKSTRDKDGNSTYYRKDGTIRRTSAKDGTEVYYREDGKTIDFIKNKDGKKTCDMGNKISEAKGKLQLSEVKNDVEAITVSQTEQSIAMGAVLRKRGNSL